MTPYKQLAQALVDAGHLKEEDIEQAAAILAENLTVADAEDTKAFAVKDLAYQERVIRHAEEMAEEDLEMRDLEDRFVQAEVIESAHSLAEKDMELIERADDELALVFLNASGALVTARLVDESYAAAVARLIADAWESSEA